LRRPLIHYISVFTFLNVVCFRIVSICVDSEIITLEKRDSAVPTDHLLSKTLVYLPDIPKLVKLGLLLIVVHRQFPLFDLLLELKESLLLLLLLSF